MHFINIDLLSCWHYRNQLKKKKENYDPIDYESVDKLDFWVHEEDPTPEFDNVESTNIQLEQMARDFEGF